jgi:hypothetical protein
VQCQLTDTPKYIDQVAIIALSNVGRGRAVLCSIKDTKQHSSNYICPAIKTSVADSFCREGRVLVGLVLVNI